MSVIARIIAALTLACASLAASANNIVLNPGFEEGVKHWQYEHFRFIPNPLWAHTGPGVARMTYCDDDKCLDTLNVGAYISQLLSTQAGEKYDLSFWVRSFAGESRFSVFWDGAMLAKSGTPNGPMQRYSFTGIAASANATLLQIHGYNSTDQHMSFDDFSVVRHIPPMMRDPAPPALPVSEPAIYGLILVALGVMVLTLRRPIA